MAPVKRLLLLATLFAVALPGPASAAANPCRNKIFNDWYRDGKIASSYPVGCYRDALKHIPIDAKVYSSLGDDVRAAMRAAIRRTQGFSVPSQVGHGRKPPGPGRDKSTLASANTPMTPHDPATPSAVASAPVASTSGGTPLPILVLGGLALALVAAGALGAGVRYARGRRPR
jgi:hypothetical protein